MKWTIVYFDDQVSNIEAMSELLSGKFDVIGCNIPTHYPQFVEKYRPHAYLLDVHMPQMDGYGLYDKLITHPLYNGCPIIFISGDLSDENRIRSHISGAIDFLPRNLKSEELMTRLMSKVRLHQQTALKLVLGNLMMDIEALKVYVDQKMIDLTLLEMRILGTILRSYPEALTRSALIKKIWGEENIKPGTINTHITNLKPKINAWNHTIRFKEERVLLEPKDYNF